MLGKILVDFSVARNRLRNTGLGIPISVVLAAVSNQFAPVIPEFLYQILSLHGTTKSLTLRMPGIWPPVMSW